jgi:hypothetical protein
MSISVDDILSVLMESGVLTSDVVGCTVEEVLEVERELGVVLPTRYRQFLERLGKGAGRFLRGSSVFYPTCLDLTAIAREMLIEEREDSGIEIDLPSDAIVILMHQGYQFYFIRASEGEDPPVYFFHETGHFFRPQQLTFTQFFLQSARQQARKGWLAQEDRFNC